MVDNLPLIPGKGTVCTDVRPVLRTVFRELDYLPPLACESPSGSPREDEDETLTLDDHWIEKYKSECKDIWNQENEIKRQRAKRISREPLPNIFKLHEAGNYKEVPKWKLDKGLIDRRDLAPTNAQTGRNVNLWIKNILNVSSCELSVGKSPRQCPSMRLSTIEGSSVQTISMGQVRPIPVPPPHLEPPPPVQVNYIVCVPAQVDFVNTTIGCSYAQTLRLVNISKFACRLALSLPKSRELEVTLHSPMGLTVTSGATAELKLIFKPTDVRGLSDTITVKVSYGQVIVVPISCFMQPPILDISIPNAPAPLVNKADQVACEVPRSPSSVTDMIELGTRLLGDVHCEQLLLQCNAEHAAFFVLTEDAWLDWNLDCMSNRGSVLADTFVWWPAWWRGGGAVSARVWCRAHTVGAHTSLLRLLSSTATNRQLHLLADVLYFKPEHLTIEAHEKDYDINSDEDPACDYYVNLGISFPHRSLSTTIQLVNHSPVRYSYYWRVRPWGLCYCWEERQLDDSSTFESGSSSEVSCAGASESKHLSEKDPSEYRRRAENACLVSMEQERGVSQPRSTSSLEVRVHDTGSNFGVQRAVFMLVIRNVPKESIQEEYKPMIINTQQVQSPDILGFQRWTREVCEVMTAQIEVWWEVVPVKLTFLPPVLPLYHSRRMNSISVNISALQLYGLDKVRVVWLTPKCTHSPLPLSLTPTRYAAASIKLPLYALPHRYPQIDMITLVADNEESKTNCVIWQQCATRYPSLRPPLVWLGIVYPLQHMQRTFTLINNTCQPIEYWCKGFRWIGEENPRPICLGQIPCGDCKQQPCTCKMLEPTSGELAFGETENIRYDVNAPLLDGCVATLVQVKRSEGKIPSKLDAPGTEGRAALIAYRVIAPRLLLRVLPCRDDDDEKETDCPGTCGLDPGVRRSKLGAAVLRPSKVLILGRRSCYRLRLTNVTPLSTVVEFDKPIDGTEFLKVMFIPNKLPVGGYDQVDVRVVIDARKMCERRLFVYRACVLRAHKPLYLVIDTAVSALEITCHVPIGGDVTTKEFVVLRRTQKEDWDTIRWPSSHDEIFAAEDRKREFVKANECFCPFHLEYIPPPSSPRMQLRAEDYRPPIEFVYEPPPLTRVCSCRECMRPLIPDPPHSISLEFVDIPLRKVFERKLMLRNETVMTAYWSAAVRRFGRRRNLTLNKDKWADDVCPPGVVINCSPSRGVLSARALVVIKVQVYADCWGLYWDQILIQIEKVEPIVMDVWVHAVGPPLHIKLKNFYEPQELPTMWMSMSDPVRSLLVKNVSRSELLVHAYITRDNERTQDLRPFRLFLRLFDTIKPVMISCSCISSYDTDIGKEEITECGSIEDDDDVSMELYLSPDHGQQDNNYYQISPQVCSLKPGECMEWEVKLITPSNPDELIPDCSVLLRLLPQDNTGDYWHRGEPPPQLVRLRQAVREPCVKATCDEVLVKLCALDLPYGDVLRVRKRFFVQNVGSGGVDLSAHTSVPWCLVRGSASRHQKECGEGCFCHPERLKRDKLVYLSLPPMSSIELCVEVCIPTSEAWPSAGTDVCVPPRYSPSRRETTPLHLYDDHHVLLTLPLTVELDYPMIKVEPSAIDMGCVTDGVSKKVYFEVSHTCTTASVVLKTKWVGPEEFEIWPPFLQISPGYCERVYIQYNAAWRQGHAKGYVIVRVAGGAGGIGEPDESKNDSDSVLGWCRAAVPVQAAPVRDYNYAAIHDLTDDQNLPVRHFQ